MSVLLVTLRTHAGDNVPAGLWKDSGMTIPATQPGDAVVRWSDALGVSGAVFTCTNSFLEFVDGVPMVELGLGANAYLSMIGTFPLTDRFMAIRYRNIQGSPNNVSDGDYSLSVSASDDATAPDGSVLAAENIQPVGGLRKTAPSIPFVAREQQTGGNKLQFINGVLVSTTTSDTSTGTANILNIGCRTFGGVPLDGYYDTIDVEAVYFGNGLSESEANAIDSILGVDTSAPLIVCAGDSITDGFFGAAGSVGPTETWPSQFQALRPGTTVINQGVYGLGVSGLVSLGDTVDAMWRPGAILNIEIGTNDLNAAAYTAAQTLSQLDSYCAARVPIWGDQFIFRATITDRQDQGANQSNFNAQRAAYNQGIIDRGNCIDISSDPLLGANGAANNSTIFQPDKVHLKPAGHALFAQIENESITMPSISIEASNAESVFSFGFGFGKTGQLGSAFSPSDISGLVLWLDADNIPDPDGSSVSIWPDASEEGNNATQATAISRPTLRTNDLNGHKSVEFDGVNDYLQTSLSAFTSGADYSAFYVTSVDPAHGGGSTVFSGAGGGPFRCFHLGYTDANTWQRFDGNSFTRLNRSLIEYICQSNSETFWENTTQKATGTNGATDSGNIYIGTPNSLGFTFKGKIFSLYIFEKALNEQERSQMETFIHNKYPDLF